MHRGDDGHADTGVYLCAGCQAAGVQTPLYTSRMQLACNCGWPSFWTNVRGAVYAQKDADLTRYEILCSQCDCHLGHVFRGERHAFPTDERHCVNSISLKYIDTAWDQANQNKY